MQNAPIQGPVHVATDIPSEDRVKLMIDLATGRFGHSVQLAGAEAACATGAVLSVDGATRRNSGDE